MITEKEYMIAWQRASDAQDIEWKMNPRTLLLNLPQGERRFVFPGGYEITSENHLFRLDKKGQCDRLITNTPAFVVEYLLVKGDKPRRMAKIAYLHTHGLSFITTDIPYGFSRGFWFKLVDCGLLVHEYTIPLMRKFMDRFAELNKDTIPIREVESAPPLIKDFSGRKGEFYDKYRL